MINHKYYFENHMMIILKNYECVIKTKKINKNSMNIVLVIKHVEFLRKKH